VHRKTLADDGHRASSYALEQRGCFMQGRICVITGASSGLGKATALGLAKLGATVVMVCRDETLGEAARQDIVKQSGSPDIDMLRADLSSQTDIYALAETFKQHYDKLHVLINNAGVYLRQRHITKDGFEQTFAVNYLAPFLLTHLLLETLQASAPARIITVAGAYHQQGKIHFDDLHLARDYTGATANNQSQLARVLFTYELARRLEGTGVTANCLHPGSVRTEIMRDMPKALQFLAGTLFRPLFLSSEQGAKAILYLATSPEVETISGHYFVKGKSVTSSEASYERAPAQRLWTMSEWLTGFYELRPPFERRNTTHSNLNSSKEGSL
jgi:NAD(P)-dependent dehydrogenase (short-subunit alcohol dehydrogenase family)